MNSIFENYRWLDQDLINGLKILNFEEDFKKLE